MKIGDIVELIDELSHDRIWSGRMIVTNLFQNSEVVECETLNIPRNKKVFLDDELVVMEEKDQINVG